MKAGARCATSWASRNRQRRFRTSMIARRSRARSATSPRAHTASSQDARYWSPRWSTGWCACCLEPLLVQEPALVKTPRGAVVQIEMPVGAEVLAGKIFAIGFGHEPFELFVVELVEL